MSLISVIAGAGGLAPTAPTIGTATDGGTGSTVSVAFTASSYLGKGGGSVTYTATSSPGGFTATGASSPITVTGLSSGTAYTFTVKATTSYGVTGPSSAASNSVTPAFPVTAYEFFSSGTWTPNSYPATYQSYIIGGGAGMGSTGVGGTGNIETFGGGGGGGAGYFTTVGNQTINSGSVVVTIGAAGGLAGNGSASSVGASNAAGGTKGTNGGANANNGVGGAGGAGGSGGGGGSAYKLEYNTGFIYRVNAGSGGTGGGSGNGGDAPGGSGSGVSTASCGGSGGEGALAPFNPTYNGFSAYGGNTYGANRGVGGGYTPSDSRGYGSAGYVLIVRNA